MPAIAIRVTRSPKRQRLVSMHKSAVDEIRSTIDKKVKKRAIEYCEKVVSNWEHKPKFIGSTYIDSDKISLYVEPVGENAKYWIWTSRGTKPHQISAGTVIKKKRSSLLAFRKNYNPKTRPGPTYGGPGKGSGPIVFARVVNHPGTRPRKFEEWIGKNIKGEFRSDIEAAFRRGSNKQ
jgi:hypothetical protein